MSYRKFQISKAALLTLILLTACGDPPTIHLNARVPPTFSFSGSRFAEYRHLHFFFVKEVAAVNENRPYYEQNLDANKIIWQIWPDNWERGQVENLPLIIYGAIPEGWIQKVPQEGSPPVLIEGKVYEAGGPPTDSHKAQLRFMIRAGEIVKLPLPLYKE